jgi:tRNA-dihydrouridine synthase B
MRIGPYQLANNLVLAPMAGVTDRPFRQLCRRLGAGLTISEMVSANSALRTTGKTLRRLDHAGEEAPVSVQIVGADPRVMADGARANVDRGAQIIDINMGCPAKKVCRAMAGSALLRNEDLVARILDRVVAAVDVPVTLKIRTGWDLENRNAIAVARLAEQAGIQALAIHGRTRACRFEGHAEFDTIRRVKQTVSIPVIANGDITGPEKAKEVLEYSGADAVMIGRAAQGRPWIFREIEHYLTTGRLLPEPAAKETRTIMIEHLEHLYSFYGADNGIRVARKHIGWYSRGRVDAVSLRERANRADSPAEQLRIARAYFDSLSAAQELAA